MSITGALLLTTACITTVQPGERGLLWHLDGLANEPLKDGVYWTAPWNDIYRYDVRWQSYTENVDAWSADDLQIVVKAAIILRPEPQEVYHLAQTIGTDYYARIVKPEFLAAVRNVVSEYSVVTVPEKSAEIAKKIQKMVEEKVTGRHLAIHSVALADVDFPQMVLTAIELKQAKEQEKEQKEFELLIAAKEADITRMQAKGEGDAIRLRAEGQAIAQETITKTLTPEYLRYKLYDGQTSKMVLLPEDLKLPIFINPGEQEQAAELRQKPMQNKERSSAETSGKMQSDKDPLSASGNIDPRAKADRQSK